MLEPQSSSHISVHEVLGGGSVADLFLWKRKGGSILLLAAASAFWYLFERAGYNILSFLANVMLLLVIILFFWAKAAILLNRPLPNLPDMEVTEESVAKAADMSRVWINRIFAIAREISLERNFKRLAQVLVSLWVVSYVGNLANFLTFLYIGVVLGLSIPVLYDKFQPYIDEKMGSVYGILEVQYKSIENMYLRNLPSHSKMEKKTQ